MAKPDDHNPEELDAFAMSDEDFMKLDPSAFDREDEGQTDPDLDDSQNEDDSDDEDGGEGGDDQDLDNQDPNAADLENDKDDSDSDDPDKKDDSEGESDDDQDKSGKPDGEEPEKQTGELADADLINIGKQVMSEFKANGSTIKMKSADDVIRLMQMGANYHKKMTGLKPSLKTLKLLENHDLLDPQKLNYLIDLHEKKPEAITKLLKDSKIDPMGIDTETEANYVPNNRTVDDKELVLDEVLEEIKDTDSYQRTLTVISTDWDDSSRSSIAKEPQLIRTINGHIESGIFDQVAEAVAYDKSLGKLTGVSDLDAYIQMGNHMHENNLFKSATGAQPENKKESPPLKPQQAESDVQRQERQNRKKAASPSRQQKAPAKKGDYNPLEMSDEEFLKINSLSL